ncbi:flavin-containing monooxygenase [Colletotrichum sojae]|uniref:Flavin-containing monooxygenase n=1 Tax=Colletotrichum sojae TaxID=2175907 RepID=A0A8H6MJJ5_9PEZI|nr:flavin-containing monooxygenase [Colletotrichum sojae]
MMTSRSGGEDSPHFGFWHQRFDALNLGDMKITMISSSSASDAPVGDLRMMMAENPLPAAAPLSAKMSMSGHEPTEQARIALYALNNALAAKDYDGLKASLLETKELRGIIGSIHLSGSARFIPATPPLQFIDSAIVFRTASPAATCSGRLVLLPATSEIGDGQPTLGWKVWILSTTLENLEDCPEDASLLTARG